MTINVDFIHHAANSHTGSSMTLAGVTGGLLAGSSIVGWISAACAICGVIIQIIVAINAIRRR